MEGDRTLKEESKFMEKTCKIEGVRAERRTGFVESKVCEATWGGKVIVEASNCPPETNVNLDVMKEEEMNGIK